MTRRFYLPACTRKQVVWMAFPSKKTPYPAQAMIKNRWELKSFWL